MDLNLVLIMDEKPTVIVRD